ncbi:serpin family protein [uncultured Draconibacterium sp.]|uniref:serpin family protein n=1 Tax=uncultured Draconibacterium sp. TaxID=1573823 RepID=UPI002AA8B489|nr:serpin family protein [uncultured Draconibacterium sp.]
MKTKFTILLLAIMGLLSCQKEDENNEPETRQPKSITLPHYAEEVLSSNNNFGVSLFTSVAADEQENIMLSPLSANIALNMAMNAAGGNTFAQMRDMLGYSNLSQEEVNEMYKTLVEQLLTVDDKVTLNLANAMFYENSFSVKEAYKSIMQTDYQVDIECMDFGDAPNSLSRINGWASDNTNGKIEKVLNDISAEAVMFLLNAVYFKGDWTQQFEKQDTQDLQFTLDNEENIEVPTMSGKIPLRRYGGNDFSAYELSYGRDNFVMDLILPTESLAKFLTVFDADMYAEMTEGLGQQDNKTEYNVLLPKFKFKYEEYLDETLELLGMTDAFNPYKADFSNLSEEPTYISFVKQNTYIDVNEEGTEAAAVTTIGFERNSASGETPTIHFNKPFVFAIRERTTNTLLFVGTIYNPLEE